MALSKTGRFLSKAEILGVGVFSPLSNYDFWHSSASSKGPKLPLRQPHAYGFCPAEVVSVLSFSDSSPNCIRGFHTERSWNCFHHVTHDPQKTINVYGLVYGFGTQSHKRRLWKAINAVSSECFPLPRPPPNHKQRLWLWAQNHKRRLWRTINALLWEGDVYVFLGGGGVGYIGSVYLRLVLPSLS